MPLGEPFITESKKSIVRLTIASGWILMISWLCFAIGVVAACDVWATTPETGTEKEVATVMAFALYGWPAFITAFVEFIYGLVVIRNVSKTWTTLNLFNPVAILIMPFVIAAMLGFGPD